MNTKICATVAIMLLTTACATTAPRRHFDDIQLPPGLTYQPDRSVVIESPAVKAAQLVYRGRLEPESLGAAMRARLEATGWRPISRTSTAKDGTRQTYEKGGNALEVHIWEGLWFTYVAISASEALPTTTAQAREDGVQTTGAVSGPDRAAGRTTAVLDVDAPAATERPAASERQARAGDASFTQRVKDFFAGLFTW